MDMCRRNIPPAVTKVVNKREQICGGCNRSLNVFQPTTYLYCNNGVSIKRGEVSYLYIFGTIVSEYDIHFHFAD
jgi:hypothetical protein